MAIFILDINPRKAAQSLTIPHATNYIKRLKFSFALAHVSDAKKPSYFSREIPEVTYSKQNYVWFSEFYRELCKMINPENIRVDIFKDEYVFLCKNIKFQSDELLFNIQQPKVTNEEIINNNRLKYIEKRYNHRKFKYGFPEWYLHLDNDVFKKYNSNLKRNFKIEYENGRYQYYVADYFNQWIKVKDVPLEIDGFILTILQNKN